jgi:hypothetical protein
MFGESEASASAHAIILITFLIACHSLWQASTLADIIII